MSVLNTKALELHQRLYNEYKRRRIEEQISERQRSEGQRSEGQRSESHSSQLVSYRHKSVSNNEWKGEVIKVEDVYIVDNFTFVYDLQFLNYIKSFTKELRLSFVTEESKSKSRNLFTNIEPNTESSKELIQKIKDKIKDIENLPEDIHDIKESVCEPNNSEVPVYRRDQPLFTQQFIYHLHSSKKFRFCNENYTLLLPLPEPEPEPQSTQTLAAAETKFCEESSDSKININTEIFDSTQRKLEIINRHKWTNTDYNISTGITLKADPENKVRTHSKRKKQLKFVLEKILDLINENIFCTKRDLYYQNVLLFNKSQRVVDEIIDDLACSLRVSRTRLHIVSSTRGLVYGHLKFFNTNGVFTDCLSSPNGINIPNDTEKITRMQSEALFVLIIEKDATFQQFIDLKIEEKFPIIMVTGHGYPDMNTRAFVQMIWNTFEIPIFGLVDGDAHGLEILCTFRHGSLALSYESPNLVTPVIRWLGVLPTDIIDYRLSHSVQIDLTKEDIKKIEDLKNRIYMIGNEMWTKQLNILLKIGKKVEIQSLAEHWPTFLLDVYLTDKIRHGKWI